MVRIRMPRLGRPITATLCVSALILIAIYGGMEIWPRIETYRRMRSLDHRWRDRTLSATERVRAVEMLSEYGAEAAPYLLAAARDTDGRLRARVFTFLAGLEPIPEEAMRICLTALERDVEPRARATAATSLGVWAYLLRQEHPDRRRRILDALVAAGGDASPIVRRAAVRAMVGAEAIGIDPCPWLSDVDRSVRLAAADAIFWLDPAHKDRTVPVLQTMIREAGPDRPVEVARPLALLSRADPSACRGLVPTFVSWLGDEDAEARGHVIFWLAQIGPMARDAAPALEAMLDRGGPADRIRVAFAIICVDPSGCERAADCLRTLIGDPRAHPRDRAMALSPIDVLLKQPRVPARLREQMLASLRPIPDQPGIYPDLGYRIRQFIEFHEHRGQGAPGQGPAARLISDHPGG